MSKTEQLKKLIENIVRKEVRALLPHLVKEVMANMIMESATPSLSSDGYDNSNKRKQLLEQTPRQPSQNLVSWEDDDSFDQPSHVRPPSNLNTITEVYTDSGMKIPVDPNRIPEAVLKAMNTDYRGFMEEMKKYKR
jgi:hypothetical protein